MKKISNKLFREFEINENKQQNVIGGLAINTSTSSDTNVAGGGYDISFDTLDGSGNSTGIDPVVTNAKGTTGTTDQPGC